MVLLITLNVCGCMSLQELSIGRIGELVTLTTLDHSGCEYCNNYQL